MQWFSHWLMAYFTILFPPLQNKPYSTSWYNPFDNFYYNRLGLRYDSVSNVYVDLLANQYYFDQNQQIYWNHQNIIFDKLGLNYSPNKRWAIDFLGNHYHWCPLSYNYQYSGFWSFGLWANRLVKASPKPLCGPSVAARIFLLKNDPFRLPIFKDGFTVLVISAFITVNPIGDISIIDKNNPLKSEPTRALAQFTFQNLETFQPKKATKTQLLAKPPHQKQIRVSVSANQTTSRFDLDSPMATISVNSFTNPTKYNSVDLLQDLAKCLDVHTKTFLDHKQKQNLDVDPSLKSGIRKLYKQLDIATNLAREKQEKLKQFGSATQLEGTELVTRLNETIEKRAFDKKGNTIIKNKKKNLNLNQTVAQQLREYGRFPLSGIQTFVTIKSDPEAALTPKEKTLITQEFAKTPNGKEIEALGTINAHILSDSWSTLPTRKDAKKVLSYKLPFNRFRYQVIQNKENRVLIPDFIEKLLDNFKNVETGVFPTFLQKKYVYDPGWTLEKNYILANAIYDNFYMPVLSQNEKRLVLQKRDQMNVLKTDKNCKSKTEKIK